MSCVKLGGSVCGGGPCEPCQAWGLSLWREAVFWGFEFEDESVCLTSQSHRPGSSFRSSIHCLSQSRDPISCYGKPVERTN